MNFKKYLSYLNSNADDNQNAKTLAKTAQKVLSRLLIVCMFVSLIVFRPQVADANSVDSLQEQLDQNEKELEEMEAELERLNQEEDILSTEIITMDIEIGTLRMEASALQITIDDLNAKIESNENFIEKLEGEIDENNLLLEQRLRTAFIRGDVGYLDVIFKAESLIDALTRMDMIQFIVREDVKLLGEIEDQKSNLEDLKATQEAEKATRTATMDQLNYKIGDLESSYATKQSYMDELETNVEALKEREAKLEEASEEIENKILQLQRESLYVGGEMLWPLPPNEKRITSYFGGRVHPVYGYWSSHSGVDIGCDTGTEIYAANTGVVIVAEYHRDYGNYVIIDHGGKIASLYGHASSLNVVAGQNVEKGDLIAFVGSTGLSTGPHLHFEIRENGVRVDPLPYVTGD